MAKVSVVVELVETQVIGSAFFQIKVNFIGKVGLVKNYGVRVKSSQLRAWFWFQAKGLAQHAAT